jgi:hypothetical protein
MSSEPGRGGAVTSEPGEPGPPPEPRNRIMRRWERIPGTGQFLISFFVWFWIFWIGHVQLLNQPVGRGFMYGIFWGATFALLTLLATRSEQTKRYLREHPEEKNETL